MLQNFIVKNAYLFLAKEIARKLAFLGYSFMFRSSNQTANQIRRSYKNDRSNIFVTECFRDMKVKPISVTIVGHGVGELSPRAIAW